MTQKMPRQFPSVQLVWNIIWKKIVKSIFSMMKAVRLILVTTYFSLDV